MEPEDGVNEKLCLSCLFEVGPRLGVEDQHLAGESVIGVEGGGIDGSGSGSELAQLGDVGVLEGSAYLVELIRVPIVTPHVRLSRAGLEFVLVELGGEGANVVGHSGVPFRGRWSAARYLIAHSRAVSLAELRDTTESRRRRIRAAPHRTETAGAPSLSCGSCERP